MSVNTEASPTETPEEFMRREIDLFRQRIGIDFAEPLFNVRYEVATRDAIKRFSYGLGDDNPLWLEPDHAAASRWGGIIAPPGFLVSAGKTLTEFAPTEEEASRGKDALANLNLMQVGEHARWFQPVREGDSLSLRTFYIDCVLRGSEASGWVAISTFRQVFWNQRGEVVSLWDIDAIHPYNQPKVDFVPPPRSSDYLEGIDAAYDAEEVRGPLTRSVESVSVGDELPKITKGPLVSSDVVAWAQGCGRHDLAPNRLGRKKRRAGEQAYMQNKAGGWDSYMSCHWDASVSSAFGMQQPFDWGIMRCCYMMHIVSDWMGDDAILVEVRDRIRAINVLGNVTTVSGEVTGIRSNNGWPEVTVEVRCTNQDGVVTASSTARVRLPSEEHGLPDYPAAPADHGLLPGMMGYPQG
jgi:acyl dehydratase